MSAPIKDSEKGHWVNRSPLSMRPYLQLSRLDRPVGYWLLTLPGWIGLAFATLSHGFMVSDLKWATLILIGAIACLLYTSPSPRDATLSRMPSSA